MLRSSRKHGLRSLSILPETSQVKIDISKSATFVYFRFMQKSENIASLRQLDILKHGRTSGQLRVGDLASRFAVSEQTIRTDLRQLAARGAVERVHGGAILPSSVRHIGYDDRQALNSDAKARIAMRTARLIPQDSSLFLNIGTTTEAVARALRHHANLMVVTNNMNVANIMAQNETAEVIVAGGRLRRSDGALVGDEASATIARFKVDFAIIGASALDQSGDLLDFDAAEVRVTQTILQQSRAAILVADYTKFSRRAPVRIASLSEIGAFITDKGPSETIRSFCADVGTQILVA